MQLTLSSWTAYKETVVTKKKLRLQYGETSTAYEIVAVEDTIEWVYSILKDEGSEQEDFEDNYKADANQALDPHTVFGSQVATILNYPEDCEDLRQSWIVDCDAETLTILDIWIGGDLVGPEGECYLAGGAYETWTKASRGSAIHFAVVDRDDVSGAFGYYGLTRSKLSNLTNESGTFQAGETVVGGTSNASTTVLAVGSGEIEVRFAVIDATTGEDSAFEAGETITGQTSGATATLDDPPFEEGDALYLRKPFLKEEWLYHLSTSPVVPVVIQPGGSKPVPGGYYFRVLVYNADDTDVLTIKASLIMATR